MFDDSEIKIVSFASVYPTPREPGRGVFVRARLQHLAARAEVKVLAPVWGFDQGGRRWDGPVEVLHPRWLYLPGTGALSALLLAVQMLPRITRLRREFPFQIIDAHFGYPDGVAAALLSMTLRTPFTITLRGSELLHARFPVRRRLMAWALRRAARVIALSGELRGLAIGLGAGAARTTCIPNGVDGSIFRPRNGLDARLKHGIPLDRKIVLTAGHLIELKGHHRVVSAIKHLRDEGVAVQLLIAGGDPGRGVRSYQREIRSVISALELERDVRMLGHVQPADLAELMSAADVFCLASSREGWPNVVHEALSCGTPVVVTRVGAAPEMIPSDEHGMIVPPGDIPALAAALRTALARQWNRQAIAALAKERSWERVAVEALQEMRRALEAVIPEARLNR
jgi:glycosyltransferase involved in cell wall biosynthesis